MNTYDIIWRNFLINYFLINFKSDKNYSQEKSIVGRFLNSLHQRTEAVDKSNYHREQYQTYMTGPEWRNVEMAEEYAEFIKEGNSLFQFPYFRQILDLWKVIYNSYSTARKYNTMWQIITSEYMVMDLFIGFFTTVELFPKGILSLLLYPFLKKENNSEMQNHLADFYKKYAADLQTIPFYDHKYKEIREDLADKYNKCKNKTWVDWFSWTCVSIELWARRWISKPLSYWFHQDDNLVPATTDILVKYRIDDCPDEEKAKSVFQKKITELTDKNMNVAVVDNLVYTKKPSESKNYTSVYARLRVPRYAAFQEVLHNLDNQGIHLRKIAGQDRVQVKCQLTARDEAALEQTQEQITDKVGQPPVYSYGDRIHSNRRICLFDVSVRDLAEKTSELSEVANTEVKFIHNF